MQRNAGTPLAPDGVVVCESPDPATIYCYSPGLAQWHDRLIATTDWGGPGVASSLDGEKADSDWRSWQGRVYLSDDRGRTWRQTTTFPFLHARPFVADGTLYVLGHDGDLMIIRSDDGGQTWSRPVRLTEGQQWHQAPCNVHYAHGCIYLVMECRVRRNIQGWCVGEQAPVLMRGRLGDDLTCRENWTFASVVSFADIIDNRADCPQLDWWGVPFYPCPYPSGTAVLGREDRRCPPIGWLEANVVRIVNPDHIWYDPTGRTYHLWSRAHTGSTGYAAVVKVVEDEPGGGAMTTQLEHAPSGKPMLYVPCPGGQVKFHVLYDEPTRLYWLLSNQATYSMTRADRLPDGHFNLPNNERRRLQLHFSTNMIDWCFAGLVAVGEEARASRSYASMVIDGDDLHVLSRSGDRRARNAHDVNLITFHTVRNFRSLVY